MGRLILSPLGKLGAVFSILQIVLRLFHGCPPVEEDVGDEKSGSIGTKLRFGQPDDYPFRLTAARRCAAAMTSAIMIVSSR
jgi:hypothetical protein